VAGLYLHVPFCQAICHYCNFTRGLLDDAVMARYVDALVVVRVPRRDGAKALVRAAEIALRSGGFGLAVLDLVDGAPGGPPAAWQGRLLGLFRMLGAFRRSLL